MKAYLEIDYYPIGDPVKFELMCQKLWAEEWKDSNATPHGRSGQAQMGVDVYGIDKSKNPRNKEYSGIQSKKRNGRLFGKKDLTEKEIVAEVEDALKFDTGGGGRLAQLIIATTQPRDVRYQNLERKLTQKYEFDVHIKGWEDITHLLSKYPHVATQFYPNNLPPEDEELKTLKTVAAASSNSQLKLAKEYLDQGNCDSGLQVLLNIESSGTIGLSKEEKFKLYSNAAVAYSLKRDNTKVLEYLDKAYETQLKNELWYRNRAAVFLFREKFDDALQVIDEGLENFATPSLKSLRAEILFRRGDDPRTIISEYENLSAESEELSFQLAQIASQAQYREDAIKLLEQHKNTDSKAFSLEHIQTMAFLASLYIEDITSKNNYMMGHFDDQSLDRLKEATVLLDYVIASIGDRQIKPLFADIFSRRSVVYEINGKTFEAIADAKQAYDLDNLNDQSAANYAMLLMENGRLQHAHQVLQKDPTSLGHIFLDALVYDKENNHEKESQCLERVINESEKNEQRIVAYNAYIQSLIRQQRYEDALKLLDRYEEEFSIGAEALNYRAIIAQKTNNSEEVVIDYLLKAASAIKEGTLREIIGGIGARLVDYDQYEKAIEVLEKIVTTNTYDLLLEKYLIALWKERKLTVAERLCKEAIRKHGAKPLCVDILFNIAMQKSDFKEGAKLLEGIADRMESKEYSIKLALLYVENNQKQKAEAVVSQLNTHDLTSDDALGIAQVCMELDQKKKAVDILYNAILQDHGKPELQRAYISIVMMNNDIEYPETDTVAVDCAVVLESSPGVPPRIIVIEESKEQENIGQSHYHQEHTVSKQLIGKTVNDKVTIADNEYVIKSITSKYLYLFAYSRDTFSENFPKHQFMWKVKVMDDDGNFDISKIQESLSEQEKRGKQITKNIEEALFPLPAAAEISGKSYLDLIYAYIANPEHFIPSSMLTDFPDQMPEIVVLDLSVCITLYESGTDLPELEGTRYVVLASTQKILADKIRELERKDGHEQEHTFAYTENGKLRIQKSTRESLLANIAMLKKLNKWIETNVECIPLSRPDALTREEYEKTEDILGSAWADIVAEAKSHLPKSILISEDLALRKLLASEQKDIKTANSQQLLDHLRRSGNIYTNDYLKHVAYLTESGFRHTYINADDLHEAFKSNSYKLDTATQPFIEILEDESVDMRPVIGVAVQFLYKYWKSPGSQLHWDTVSAKLLQTLAKRKDYQTNSRLIELVINKVFYMVPNVAAELIQSKRVLDSI